MNPDEVPAALVELRERVTRSEIRLESLRDSISALDRMLTAINLKLDGMNASIMQGLGGARLGAWLLGFLGAIASAFVGWFVGHK